MNVGPGKWKWSTVCAVPLSALALLSAARASADPTDDAFVAALAKYGITMSGPNTAIAMAHTVCAELDNNQNTNALAIIDEGHRSLAETIQLPRRRFHVCLLPAAHRPYRQFAELAEAVFPGSAAVIRLRRW